MRKSSRGVRYVRNIQRTGFSIYEPISVGDPELWIPSKDLERLLDEGLRGIRLMGLPLRSRSKFKGHSQIASRK